MTELFFDVETTGLPARNANPKVLEDYSKCRLVSIAWVLRDVKNVYSQRYSVVETSEHGEEIGAEFIHGISRKVVDKHGVNVKDILTHFMNDCKRADLIVAHNMDFDKNVVCSELFRLGMEEDLNEFTNLPKLCTMKTTTSFCRIPNKWGSYKWPKLVELHVKLFDVPFENSHHAMADVAATVKSFYELKKRGVF